MQTAALTLAWVIGLIYAAIPSFWLAVHPFVTQWRSRKGRIFPVLLAIWLSMITVLGAATYSWHSVVLYESPWSIVVGAMLFGCGISIYRHVGHSFGGDRMIGRSELQPDKFEQRLITSGMHARIRHPIYLAHLCMLTAWTVGSGLVVMYALWAFAVVTGAIMIRTEDAELEKRFGDEYREYRKRVPAVLPF
jgi:protein-S-isoprenylcysteine O-methyltransferase Ste14